MPEGLCPRLGRIATPVTMLYPHDDRLVTAKAAATLYGTAYAALPKAKLIPIANSFTSSCRTVPPPSLRLSMPSSNSAAPRGPVDGLERKVAQRVHRSTAG